MPEERDHLKIYGKITRINELIKGVEDGGYSLDTPFPLTLRELKALTGIIEELEEQNLALQTEIALSKEK